MENEAPAEPTTVREKIPGKVIQISAVRSEKSGSVYILTDEGRLFVKSFGTMVSRSCFSEIDLVFDRKVGIDPSES